MSKIVLDEKEVNELMDSFDFSKSIYLQKLEKVTEVIERLDEIQKTQKKISDDLLQLKPILMKLQHKDEKEISLNYASYLAFLSKKIDELSKNSNLKKLENIVSNSNSIINFSIAKLAATITICIGAFYILTQLKG